MSTLDCPGYKKDSFISPHYHLWSRQTLGTDAGYGRWIRTLGVEVIEGQSGALTPSWEIAAASIYHLGNYCQEHIVMRAHSQGK